jgi:broad specificity phosphatase PhoE
MNVFLVRHGESEANAAGRLQGRLDVPLSERGRAQARQLGAWLRERRIRWDFVYSSPLLRARQTADIVREAVEGPDVQVELDLAEVSVGRLEGLGREEIAVQHPDFLKRSITDLADFSAYGGESYDELQARIRGLLGRLIERHRRSDDSILVVAHGGVNFQLIKAMICDPVPRICIVRMGNCSATRIRLRERRGVFLGELVWHIPIDLMGELGSADTGVLFR